MACSVFAFLFILFVLGFILLSLCFCVCSPLLVLLSCLSCFVVVVSFSLSDAQTKRKGAILASSLRVLWVVAIPLLRQELGNYCRRFRF